jgi:hypothetical protein
MSCLSSTTDPLSPWAGARSHSWTCSLGLDTHKHKACKHMAEAFLKGETKRDTMLAYIPPLQGKHTDIARRGTHYLEGADNQKNNEHNPLEDKQSFILTHSLVNLGRAAQLIGANRRYSRESE